MSGTRSQGEVAILSPSDIMCEETLDGTGVAQAQMGQVIFFLLFPDFSPGATCMPSGLAWDPVHVSHSVFCVTVTALTPGPSS